MTTTVTATRTIAGETFPAPGTWTIDPDHAELAFVGRHFMLTKIRGRFDDVRGTLVVSAEPSASHVEVDIAMASVSSGSEIRDTHLRSAELFDVEMYPTATFRSTSVDWSGAHGVLVGDLTIHGVTREVRLDFAFEGATPDPWGGRRAVFSAQTRLNREDFGITWNVALETGGLLVSKEVSIDISFEAVWAGEEGTA